MSSSYESDRARTANLLGAQALAVCDRLEGAGAPLDSGAAALCALRDFAAGESVDALSRILGITHSGAVRLVDRLEAEGLLERRRSLRDARALELHLTRAGRARADALRRRRLDTLSDLLGELPPADERRLTALLEQLLAALTTDRASARHICRLCESDVCGHPDRCPVTQAVAPPSA
jgi:MarR family transcriptional regulator, negative regulator of the multidrug operon emrRAB